jgi:hypothetical protein
MRKKIMHITKLRVGSLRLWLRLAAALTSLYAILCVALFIAMKQPPMKFAAVMSKLPMVSMVVLPFESLWNVARAGNLQVGDLAPDFHLQSYDKSSWVQLSSFRSDRPVVLIFGSYT